MSEAGLCPERHPITAMPCRLTGDHGVAHEALGGMRFRSKGLRAAVRGTKANGNRALRRGEGMKLSAFTRQKGKKQKRGRDRRA